MSIQRIINSVDLNSYPLDNLSSSQGERLLEECDENLKKYGAVVLEGFLNKDAVDEIVEGLIGEIKNSYFCKTQHNVYLVEDDESLPEDHPRNRKFTSTKGLLAYDQIPNESLLLELYEWPPLREFIARLMNVDALYPYEDPLSPVNINVNMDSQELNWHYDNSDFSITLMLQPAKEGGVYEYVPFIRTEENQNYDKLENIISGKEKGVNKLSQGAGALVIFKGKYTIHRVTPTLGDPRLVAVMSFSPEPGKTITTRTRQIFYGREA